jgi:prophage antirepressor-like protein
MNESNLIHVPSAEVDTESSVQVYNNPDFGEFRAVIVDDEAWFIGKEFTDILGYQNSSKAVLDHVDECDRKCLNFKANNDSLLANKFNELRGVLWANPNDFNDKWLINESGLYSLILSSQLPTAKKFKHWVTSEVLPAIHRYGYYAPKAPAVDWVGIKAVLSELYTGNQYVLALDNVYKRTHGGASALSLSGTPKLIADEQKRYYTPTSLGKMTAITLSPQKINSILDAAGLQEKSASGDWESTEKGKQYSIYVDTGKHTNSGKPVRCLNWYKDVLEVPLVQELIKSQVK